MHVNARTMSMHYVSAFLLLSSVRSERLKKKKKIYSNNQ